MERTCGWDHNTHYHEFLLDQLPRPIERALDVGCGFGLFARRLAKLARGVAAVELDAEALGVATSRSDQPNLEFIPGDFLDVELPDSHYDAITCVAAIHHMDLSAALHKMRRLLEKNGTVAILGLYREASLADYACSAAAMPVNFVFKKVLRRGAGESGETPPTRAPEMTLDQIRTIAHSVMPGARIRRHLFWRYSLVWSGGMEPCP